MEAATTVSTIGDEYRRRARRLRAVHAGNPARLYRSLKELAADQARQVIAKPTSAAQEFADLVRDSMDGPILRYSARQTLLREASFQSLGRFEANLIIAAVQHQVDCRARESCFDLSILKLGICFVLRASDFVLGRAMHQRCTRRV